MTIMCYQVLPSGRFSFLESTTRWSCLAFLWLLFIALNPHYLLFCGFILYCVQSSKNITKYSFFNMFSAHFAISLLAIFAQQPHRACKRTKSNWPRVVLFHLAHKQWNGIIKGWLHCLTSDSKERFKEYYFNVWFSMSGHDTNPIFFNKKIKIGRPINSLNPHPLASDNMSFLPYSFHPLSKWTSYVYHPCSYYSSMQ